jgi:hypothetical protein
VKKQGIDLKTNRKTVWLSVVSIIVHFTFLLFLRVPFSRFVADQMYRCGWESRAWLSTYDLYTRGQLDYQSTLLTCCIPFCIYLPTALSLLGLVVSGRIKLMQESKLWQLIQISAIAVGILTVIYVLFWFLVAIGCPKGDGLALTW